MFIAARGGWTARTASTTGRAAVALVLFRPDLLRKQTTVPKEEDLGNERCSEKEKRTRSYHAPPLPLLPHLDHWLPLSAPSDNAQPLFNPGSCLRDAAISLHYARPYLEAANDPKFLSRTDNLRKAVAER